VLGAEFVFTRYYRPNRRLLVTTSGAKETKATQFKLLGHLYAVESNSIPCMNMYVSLLAMYEQNCIGWLLITYEGSVLL
jgi:hypothetical protein